MMTFLWILFAVLLAAAAWLAIEIRRAWEAPDDSGEEILPARKAVTKEQLRELDGMIAGTGEEVDGAAGRPLLCFFSLKMLTSFPCTVRVEEIDRLPEGLVSAVSNAEVASCLHVPYNRVKVRMLPGDTVYVALLHGGRLPEGTVELPEGFGFRYYKVTVR